MWRNTLASRIEGEYYSLLPGSPGEGIFINEILVSRAHIFHHEHRVDLKQGRNVAFIIEHPLAAAGIFSIHDCVIIGNRTEWDYYRSTDREAMSRDLLPSASLGPADASIGAGLEDQMRNAIIERTNIKLELLTPTRAVSLSFPDNNRITIEPPRNREPWLDLTIYLMGEGPLKVRLDPQRGLLDENGDPEIRYAVLNARSGALVGPTSEAILHAAGDVVADLACVGGIRCGKVEVHLGPAYHRATIGLINHIFENKIVDVYSLN